MNLLNTVKRMFIGDPGEPHMLDHMPVTDVPEWRGEKLKAAAVRYGKPFKCAAAGLPREITDPRTTLTPEPSNVLPIKAKVRK